MEDHFSLRITERSRSSEQMRGNEDLVPLFESTEQRLSPIIPTQNPADLSRPM
jgi:hypothetical protein